jgi:hypothetical protein
MALGSLGKFGVCFESDTGFHDDAVRRHRRLYRLASFNQADHRRTYVEVEPPKGMTRREYDRAIRRRRKLWRLVVTFFYAVVGAIGGAIFLMILARH